MTKQAPNPETMCIDELNLSIRPYKVLRDGLHSNYGDHTMVMVADVLDATPDMLLSLKRYGVKCLRETLAALQRHGFTNGQVQNAFEGSDQVDRLDPLYSVPLKDIAAILAGSLQAGLDDALKAERAKYLADSESDSSPTSLGDLAASLWDAIKARRALAGNIYNDEEEAEALSKAFQDAMQPGDSNREKETSPREAWVAQVRARTIRTDADRDRAFAGYTLLTERVRTLVEQLKGAHFPESVMRVTTKAISLAGIMFDNQIGAYNMLQDVRRSDGWYAIRSDNIGFVCQVLCQVGMITEEEADANLSPGTKKVLVDTSAPGELTAFAELLEVTGFGRFRIAFTPSGFEEEAAPQEQPSEAGMQSAQEVGASPSEIAEDVTDALDDQTLTTDGSEANGGLGGSPPQ